MGKGKKERLHTKHGFVLNVIKEKNTFENVARKGENDGYLPCVSTRQRIAL